MKFLEEELEDLYELWLRDYFKTHQVVTTIEEFNDMFNNRFSYEVFVDEVMEELEMLK